MSKKIRVLIVDDQAVIRKILSEGLSADPMIEVVDTAPNPYIARDKIVFLKPDVLTLDVEMPMMNGIEFLKKLMPQFPIPVIMVSSLTRQGKATTMDALKAGAVDFVAKPDGTDGSMEQMLEDLRQKIKVAAVTDVSKWLHSRQQHYAVPQQVSTGSYIHGAIKLIAVGASTGGTQAFRDILHHLPPQIPGMVVVQHMPPGFTATYARTLDEETHFDVKEAENGDMIVPGRILIAPGDFHLSVKKYGADYKVNIFTYEKVQGHRPSVDVLFDSVAESGASATALGILLTGMGADGARGLLKMKQAGAKTIGQNEETSVVYGMPKVARDLGAVDQVLALSEMAPAILKHCR